MCRFSVPKSKGDCAPPLRRCRHHAACPAYSPDLRQLLHVGYKVAAEMGARYTAALEKYSAPIAACVTRNLYERHIRPLFLGQ